MNKVTVGEIKQIAEDAARDAVEGVTQEHRKARTQDAKEAAEMATHINTALIVLNEQVDALVFAMNAEYGKDDNPAGDGAPLDLPPGAAVAAQHLHGVCTNLRATSARIARARDRLSEWHARQIQAVDKPSVPNEETDA